MGIIVVFFFPRLFAFEFAVHLPCDLTQKLQFISQNAGFSSCSPNYAFIEQPKRYSTSARFVPANKAPDEARKENDKNNGHEL